MNNLNNNLNSSKYVSIERWDLLPLWIKFFTWCFLIISPFFIVTELTTFIAFGYSDANFYGLQSTGIKNIDEVALIVYCIKFLVAYGYISQKNWAIRIAITDAVIGIFICIFVMLITTFYNYSINLRLEIIILLFYYFTLQNIKEDWINIKT